MSGDQSLLSRRRALLIRRRMPTRATYKIEIGGQQLHEQFELVTCHESNRKLGVCYAASFCSCRRRRSGYRRSKVACKSSLSA
jgi:hypothetical protein